MAEWIDVIQARAFAEGERVIVDVAGSDVAVFNLNGSYYAIEDICTHDGMELSSGEREGDQIICPRHGARFCIKNGKALTPPAYEDLHCFPLRVENGMIQVRDDRWE
ncbi:MAG: non-heme iron oxygenase ferredoxin subunit [Gammaproteobacteria bacterium]